MWVWDLSLTLLGQPLLHRRPGMFAKLVFHEGGDVDRLDMGEVSDAVLGAEGGELPDRFHLRAAAVPITEMRAEEIPQPRAGFRTRGKDRGQGSAGSGEGRCFSHFEDCPFELSLETDCSLQAASPIFDRMDNPH